MTEFTFPAKIGSDAGVDVWRIEQFVPVKQDIPRNTKKILLSTDDSYIILSTVKKGSNLSWDIFYWLGETSTTDERGSAAIYTVVLDQQLGDVPVQHRETQFHESEAFLKLFSDGLTYSEDGVQSGFRSVTKKDLCQLYQVKAHPRFPKMAPIITSIPNKASSMNFGDSFVLALSKKALIWHGPQASLREKTAAAQFASSLCLGPCQVVDIDDSAFFAELSGSYEDVNAAMSVEEDESFLKKEERRVFTFKRSFSVSEEDIFLCDFGNTIYVYNGENTTPEERMDAIVTLEKEILPNEDPSVEVKIINSRLRDQFFDNELPKVTQWICLRDIPEEQIMANEVEKILNEDYDDIAEEPLLE